MRTRRRFVGHDLANSRAVLFPIPDDAPVMRIVLPLRRLDAASRFILLLTSRQEF